MKLIFAVDAINPPLTGIGRYTWELANRLKHISTIEQIKYYRNHAWVSDPAALLRPPAPAVHARKLRLSIPRKLKVPHSVRDLYWQYASKGQVFHAPNFFLPSFVENGIATIHDLSVFKFPETHPIERVRQFEQLFGKTLRIARHLITDSETTRKEVIDFFGWSPHRISAVHLGVSSSFRTREATELESVFRRYHLNAAGYTLCVSTIEPRKRVDRLIAAYARLPMALRMTYPLVLVGHQGWQSEALHDVIESAQREGWLQYHGFVAEADLPLIYAGARLFVYPSIYEGFGLPIVEAMACGVPVITSDKSCLPEVANGAAMLIDPDHIDQFTQALSEGLENPVWRLEAILIGLKTAQKYNWDDCVQRTANVYHKLMI